MGSRLLRAAVVGLFVLGAAGCAGWSLNRPVPGRETSPAPTRDLRILATMTRQALEQERESMPSQSAGETAGAPSITPAPRMPSTTGEPDQPTPAGFAPLPDRPEEIQFRTGGTSAVVPGELEAGETHTYILQAAEGQTMILGVSSEGGQVALGLKGLDRGGTLIPLADKTTSGTVSLPDTGKYQLALRADSSPALYFLKVEIPAVLEVGAGQGPVTVGGYLDILDESSPYDTRVRYLVDAELGRRLAVELLTSGFSLALTGQEDGRPYLRHAVRSESLDWEVPVSQGYYLDVYSVTGESARFTFNLEVE